MAVTKNKIDKVLIQPTPRKLKALQELSKLGLKVSTGYEYELHNKIIPGVTLKKVRDQLSSIKGSMSEFIIKERGNE